MHIGDILGPWITLLLLVVPLVYAERFIHQHMYGVGYLLTKDKDSATAVYYLIFFPGVFLHEFVQYLAAGALNVKIKKLTTRPQKQDNGTMRYDFVTIVKTDRLRASIIGGLPFVVSAILIWTISTSILDLTRIPDAFATGDLPTVSETFTDLLNTPDFWLWLYVLFAISNGMIPTEEDRQGWSFIFWAVGSVSLFLFVLGLDTVIVETLQGPIAEGLGLVNTALLIILGMDITAILILGMIEDTLERIRGEKMDYSGGKSKAFKREPGSNLPLPRGEPMPSVYNIALPLPDTPRKGTMARPQRVTPPSEEEDKPAGIPTPPKPEPARASSAPAAPGVPDPDAAARAQRDPRIPRSGASPFRRDLGDDDTDDRQSSGQETTDKPREATEAPPSRSRAAESQPERSSQFAGSRSESGSQPGRRRMSDQDDKPASGQPVTQPVGAPRRTSSDDLSPSGRRPPSSLDRTSDRVGQRDRSTSDTSRFGRRSGIQQGTSDDRSSRDSSLSSRPGRDQPDKDSGAQPARPTGRFRRDRGSSSTPRQRFARPAPKPVSKDEREEGQGADDEEDTESDT